MCETRQHKIECLQCLTTFGVREYEFLVFSRHAYNSNLCLAFLSADGTGYLQQSFSALCPGCNLQISKETLGAMKFARDLVIDSKDEQDMLKYGPGVFMA